MTHSSFSVATLGTPRIGARRELKFALEAFWAGRSDEAALLAQAAGLRAANWRRQVELGVDIVPSNDFSLYDHVLDTSLMVGAIPRGHGWNGGMAGLGTYFAMARGGPGGAAQEMTKWFDTNYHYMVPDLARGQDFTLASDKPVREYREARALGIETRPVLLGPVTYLLLAKSRDPAFKPLSLLPGLLPVYGEVLRRLAAEGASWVQIDEPCLALDLDAPARAALRTAYDALAQAAPALKLMLTSYFEGLGDSLDTVLGLPVAGLHLDLVRAPDQLDPVLARAPADLVLSLGLVDGRNVWRADPDSLLDRIEPVARRLGPARVQIAPSCSLLHVPVDLDAETGLDPDLKSWLAFSVQKMKELRILSSALSHGREAVAAEIRAASEAKAARGVSAKVHDSGVAEAEAAVTPAMAARAGRFAERALLQRRRFGLPPFPTTTIGSFPQTAEIRKARAAHARGEIDQAAYDLFLRQETERTIRWQEEIGLDVLVHGEFERNDMVQYFGEKLSGFAFTRHGWVQSYGSRYVRPPILFGDVSRPRPMTVEQWRHAQSVTTRPVKGMLTGPVTILNWSFVRDDVTRATACRQIALALRDEVRDLEAAGAAMIQVDEAALREGLPLRRQGWKTYLDWAVESFRLAVSGVADQTQIHTHMCYSEFNDIIDAIARMDADVLSIECSRSRMELLDIFTTFRYPNEIGPGVYDIHSPRIPEAAEIVALLEKARTRIPDGLLWVNPDCGLKTRNWDEVRPALANMVAAAKTLRAKTAG